MNKVVRDKFLHEVMGISVVETSNYIPIQIYTKLQREIVDGYDFSVWDGFGKLLNFIRSDKIPALYDSLLEVSEQSDNIFNYMYPNELADFTYEWLKENINEK